MNTRKTYFPLFVSATALLAIAASAIWTAPVLADSGTTPPAAPTPSGTGPSRKAKSSSSNSLSQVPSGTKLVVVDGNGNDIPLGSQQAQQVINSGDPIWCPSSIAVPTPGSHGCTSLYYGVGLDQLINDINNGNITLPLVNGTIWIEKGPDPSSSAITLDATALSSTVNKNMVNFSLTLKGGWNGCASAASPYGCTNGINSSPSEFNVPISITGWNNNVTLSDITVDGATTGTGLTIKTHKSITLTRVISKNNTAGGGATLDTCDFQGGKCLGNGNVTIATGTFDSNQNGDGLNVISSGMINLSYVETISNGNSDPVDTCNNSVAGQNSCPGNGAVLDNQHAASPKAVTISGSDTFSSNFSDGLDVFSTGAVSLNNMTASSNGTGGATIPVNITDNVPEYGFGIAVQNSFTGATPASTVTIAGSNQFKSNYVTGLSVVSTAAIAASNLDAESNGGAGAALVNTEVPVGHPGINLTTSSSSLYNMFTDNAFDGLDVWSDGPISVKNVTADGNGTSALTHGGVGAFLENDFVTAPYSVTLTGNNTFNENYSNVPSVSSQPMGGLTVWSNGAITAYNITANGDLAGAGADIENSGASSAQSVALAGVNIFAKNAAYDGIDVLSRGTITISNLNAVNNGNPSLGYGAYLENDFSSSAQAITLTGSSVLSYNGIDGLDIFTNGAVNLSSVSANLNKGFGAVIDNSTSSFASAVTLRGADAFNDDSSGGLSVSSKGPISVNTVALSANGNGASGVGDGVDLENYSGTSRSVTIRGVSFFDDNQGAGLYIASQGTITAGNVTANNNVTHWGVVLAESGGAAINLTGTNVLNGNGHDGITITSNGAITLNNVTADDDGQAHQPDTYGVYIVSTAAANRPVILSGTNTFLDDYSGGIYIDSASAIQLSNVTANNNVTAGAANTYGAWLDNSTGTKQSVTLLGTNTFNGNYAGGIYVASRGSINLSDVTANDNSYGPGGLLINDGPPSTSGVSVAGFGMFNDNLGGDGLDIYSSGVVTLTKITANYSGGDGLNVNNTTTLHTYAGTPNNVIITCGNFANNTGYGINAQLTTGKALTLVGGVLIDNGGGDLPHVSPGTLLATNPTCPLP
ncbi:MAG TPA: hypothetical protein VLX61_17160 [Anaerolineales bacterium]|nr:hypothetical protein [Anaerolineales bacterium]